MDELIKKQDAIDALFELYEYQRYIDPTEPADRVRQGIYLAEKKIEQLPSAQQWIPCEERMPEERGFYLVSGNGKVWICEMIILMGTKGWSNSIANPIVVAWMPLPEPWKESENEE